MNEEAKSRVVEIPRPEQPRPRQEEPLVPPEAAAGEPTLADYLDVLRGARWLIAAVTLGALLAGGAYLALAPPIFRADILVQVEEKKGLGGLDELSSMFSEKTPAETEMEILRSRLLVGAVVDELSLDLVAGARTVPYLGGAFWRRWKGQGTRPPVLGLRSFAWGGERIRVDRAEVPEKLLGEKLRLVALGEGRYRLLDPDGEEILQGAVGEPAAGKGTEVFVSELAGRPGVEFVVQKSRRAKVVEDLQRDLRISEKGKKTGVIQVALEGRSRGTVAAILDAVARNYLRQNVQRKSAEAEKTLQFIEAQIPVQKELLDRSEAELSSYRLAKGSVDLSLETKGALDRAVEIDKALTEMSLQQTELRQRFTESHPSQAALRRKQEKLLAERAAMERKLKLLPEAELESARLFRDVKTATELYFLLVNKAQELRVVKSGTIGNVRIIDMAVLPWAPVSPKRAPTLALSLLLGLALGVGFAFVRKALDQGVDDPEVVERATGVSVYATVPHSVRQDELVRQFRRDRTLARPVLAAHDKDDLAVEALRSLRTALQFSLLEARSNLLCVGGASPNAGKSFVATNLSWVLADAGKRVVLVDADLRKGRLHHYLGGDRTNGLSDVVAGVLPLEQALRPTQIAQLHFLPTGALPPNPLDLLGSERFRGVLDDLSLRYDLVLLDTPPILAVADGAVIARLAGVNMIVLRAGRHPVREIALAAKRYRQNGVVIHGAIMNDVKLEARFSGTYAYHYQYEYKRDA